MNCISKLWTIVGYLVVILGVLSLILPSMAMNYIKNQVKTGEWGGDFKAEDYINKYNYTAPVEEKDDDEDFGDDADGSWKSDDETKEDKGDKEKPEAEKAQEGQKEEL